MIYAFHGKNLFLSRKSANSMLRALLDENTDYELLKIECDKEDINEIFSKVENQDMFSSNRIIYLKRLYSNKKKADIYEYLLDSNSDDILVFWEDQKIPSNTKIFKKLKALGSIEESVELNKRTFNSWAKQELDQLGILHNPAGITTLGSMCNYDPERFLNEVEKIRLSGTNNLAQVDFKSLSNTFEDDIWSLIEAINKNDRASYAKTLKNLFEFNVEPLFILTMIARHYRLLLMSSHLEQSGATNSEMAKLLKVPPFTLPGMLKSISGKSHNDINKVLQKIVNLDFEIKTGNIDPSLGLTLLAVVI